MRLLEFVSSDVLNQLLKGTVWDKNLNNPNAPKRSNNKPNTKPNKATPSGNMIMPVNARISSPFGWRSDVGRPHNHLGVDFATPIGTPVKAPENAIVSSAGPNGGSAGVYVILNANGVVHKFYHLSRINVKPGQTVKQGDVIAFTGSSGYSTGPHLHWEKHVAGKPVNPVA